MGTLDENYSTNHEDVVASNVTDWLIQILPSEAFNYTHMQEIQNDSSSVDTICLLKKRTNANIYPICVLTLADYF